MTTPEEQARPVNEPRDVSTLTSRKPREVSAGFVVFMVSVFMLLMVLTRQGLALGLELHRLSESTGQLIGQTLLNYLPFFAILGALWWRVGRLSPHDLGLVRSHLAPALLWGLGFWIAAQLLALGMTGGEFAPAPLISGGRESTATIGRLLGQLLGNALCEELFWRGFVMVQLSAIVCRRFKLSPTRALLIGVLVSSLLFALSHLPRDLETDATAKQLVVLQVAWFAGGLAFAGLYALSGNLFLAIVFHSLSNTPTPLLEGFAPTAAQAYFALAPLGCLAMLRMLRGPGKPADTPASNDGA